MKILHIISSPQGDQSISRKLGKAISEKLLEAHPGADVTETDLTENPYPHLNAARIKAIRAPKDQQTEEDKVLLTRSDAAVNQLFAADIIVISMPLFNFGVPSPLKTWLDNVVRAGATFSYTPNGPVGLLTGKKVYIALASGGVYSQGPMQQHDHAVPYLRSVLGFMGITDIEVARAEGIGIPELRETALEKAIEEIAM